MSQPPAWADKFIGIPYKAFGRERSGADCWYFFCLVMREQFGVTLPTFDGVGYYGEGQSLEISNEARRAIGQIMSDNKDALWEKIPAGSERPGDGILLNMIGIPMHVGVVCAPGLFLHCERGCDSCVERYTSGAWSRRIEGFYRYRSSAD